MSLRVRKKKNKSGSISIHIIDRTNRGYKVVESLGSSKDEKEIEFLYQKALERVDELENNLFFISNKNNKIENIKNILSDITTENFIPIGDELIYGRLFDELGCKDIFKNLNIKELKIDIRNKEKKDFLFRALVISRLVYPGSKLELIHYLEYFKNQTIDIYAIYRFLDTLYHNEIKHIIEKCVFKHTLKRVNNTLRVSFYDITTLYFESEKEDDLRRIGFSKDGKIAKPQILLGLFTTLDGYPLSFEIYHGKQYEGHTLIDILIKFQKKFNIKEKPIVVADRGMLNDANIAYLEDNGYKYILAYKIKNAKLDLIKQIANLVFLSDNTIHTILLEKDITYTNPINNQIKTIHSKQRLILSYSTKRAKRDKYQREKAIKELKEKLNNKFITKKDLKLAHNAKYLDIDNNCKIKYKLNPDKIKLQEKLDGIKGFLTNDNSLNPKDVVTHYKYQYDIEKAFKISKTDLRIRPIYHRLENRIKTHILISFVAYAVYKEFERRLKEKNIKFNFSQKFLRKIIEHFIALKIDDELIPINPSSIQKQILEIFD